MHQGWSLQFSFSVDQKGVASPCDFRVGDEMIEAFRVECGSEHEVAAGSHVMFHGNDEVGDLAKSEKHIADMDAPLQHLPVPGLSTVVDALELIGAGINSLVAQGIDHPQVGEASKGTLEIGQNRRESFRIIQGFKTVVPNDEIQSGSPLFQKKGNGSPRVRYHTGSAQSDFRLHGLLRHSVVDGRDRHQRH